MIEKIAFILKEYSDAPVTESSSLIEDLGLDSFLIVYFLSQVEDFFHIEIDASSFYSITTVGDVLDLIRQAENVL